MPRRDRSPTMRLTVAGATSSRLASWLTVSGPSYCRWASRARCRGARSSPARAAGTGSRFARPTSRGIRSSIDRTAWAVVISLVALIGPACYLCYQSFFGSKQSEDSTMPHVTARVPEARLAGREPALIAALTDAVVQVYGEWARDHVVVHLDGIPHGRWGVGGMAANDAA